MTNLDVGQYQSGIRCAIQVRGIQHPLIAQGQGSTGRDTECRRRAGNIGLTGGLHQDGRRISQYGHQRVRTNGRTEGIRHGYRIKAGIGWLHIGQGQSAVGGSRQIDSIENPLIIQGLRAGSPHGQGCRVSGVCRRVRWLGRNRNRHRAFTAAADHINELDFLG